MYYGFNPNWMLYNPNYVVQRTPNIPQFPSVPAPMMPQRPGGTMPMPVQPYGAPSRRTPMMDPYPDLIEYPGTMPVYPGRGTSRPVEVTPTPSPTQRNGAPTTPPPQYTPQKPQAAAGYAYMVDPVVIQYCLGTYTYVWLKDGSEFWYYPFTLGESSVGGYLWDGTRWVYYGLDVTRIDTVTCSV